MMSGIAIIRVQPPDPDQDPSKKAIENLMELSSEIFDYRLLVGANLEDANIEDYTPGKKLYNNIGLRIYSLIRYQLLVGAKIIKERDKIDVALFHAGGYLMLPVILLCNLFRIDTVVAVIGEPSEGYKDESLWGNTGKLIAVVSRKIERAAYLSADRITVFSNAMTNYDLLKGLTNKTSVLMFNYIEVPEEITCIESRKNTIIYFGRICNLKGADKLAKAVKILSKKNINVVDRLVVVGDGNLRADIQQDLQKSTDIDVEFTGWLERERALEIVENTKLFILPSRSEGLPKTLQESMARGTIPLVTPVGDIPEFINHSENGMIISEEPEKIAETIIEVMDEDMESLSSESHRTAEQKFSYLQSKRQFYNIFDEYHYDNG